MANYCEDYPCCGHTNDDPCGRQPYDEPGYYDTTIRGNEHALCDHENGECDVEEDEPECEGCGDGGGCDMCDPYPFWQDDLGVNREAEESMLGRPLFPNEY
jgi:hypothetical protein